MRKHVLAVCLVGLVTGCKSKPAEVAVAPADSNAPRIYVTNEVSGDLTVIDSGTSQVIATVPLGKRPRGIHASPDGETIYVALSGSPIAGPDVDESTLPPPDKSADGIGVFDVATNKLVKVIKGGSDPENFDVSKDGTQLFISNEDDEAVSVVDAATGTLVKSAKVGAQPEGVKVMPDGKLVWVTSEETGTIAVLDPVAGKILKTFKIGHRPRSVAFLPDGSKAYVNAENDGAVVLADAKKNEVIKPISIGQPGVIKPMAVLLSPDASKLYVSTGRGHKVFTVDTATNTVTGSVEVGARPWGDCAFAGCEDAVLGEWAVERHLGGGPGDEYGGEEDQGGDESVGCGGAGSLMRVIVLEVCVEDEAACAAALEGGASRLEVCSRLDVGGVTPSLELVRKAVATGLPVHAMIRPRGGDFVYSDAEFEEMLGAIDAMRGPGVRGVVFGVLRGDRTVDVARTKELVERASGLEVTFHRAFDEVARLEEGLEDVIACGCGRLLTSGGAPDVVGGAEMLGRLVGLAAGRIEIAVGGGLRLKDAQRVARVTGARHFHGTMSEGGALGLGHGVVVGQMLELLRTA